jgi:hypothetical protein
MNDINDAKETKVEKDGILKGFLKKNPTTQRTKYYANQIDCRYDKYSC